MEDHYEGPSTEKKKKEKASHRQGHFFNSNNLLYWSGAIFLCSIQCREIAGKRQWDRSLVHLKGMQWIRSIRLLKTTYYLE